MIERVLITILSFITSLASSTSTLSCHIFQVVIRLEMMH